MCKSLSCDLSFNLAFFSFNSHSLCVFNVPTNNSALKMVDQPKKKCINLDVGMILGSCSKLSGGPLLLSVFVEVGMSQDGHSLALVAQSESSRSWKKSNIYFSFKWGFRVLRVTTLLWITINNKLFWRVLGPTQCEFYSILFITKEHTGMN